MCVKTFPNNEEGRGVEIFSFPARISQAIQNCGVGIVLNKYTIPKGASRRYTAAEVHVTW